MKTTTTLLFILLLIVMPAADAAKAKKAPLRWYESHGEIVLDTICDDFAYGSIDYRECRSATKQLFEERCSEYRDKADRARGERREEFSRQQEKFCSAASRFGPVN